MAMTNNPAGRPQKEINWTLFEDLCSLQCTQSEIASVMHIHQDTLRDRTAAHYKEEYSIVYKRYSENGKTSLRRYQFNLAKKNTAMAIWLGKQWLDQKENVPIVHVSAEILQANQKLMAELGRMQVELQAVKVA